MSEKTGPMIDETLGSERRTGGRARCSGGGPSRRRRALLVLVVALSMFAATAGTSAASASSAKRDFCTTMRPKLSALVKNLKAPGAVVLVRSPKIDCFLSFGTRTLNGRKRIGPDDQFRIGSITKTMTGTVILQLVQEGKLRLGDPVSKYHVGVPNGGGITIAQMLSMRSGLRDFTGLPAVGRMMDAAPQRVWSPDEMLSLSYTQAPRVRARTGLPLLECEHRPVGADRRTGHRPAPREAVRRADLPSTRAQSHPASGRGLAHDSQDARTRVHVREHRRLHRRPASRPSSKRRPRPER